jgi:DNA-directed RNA polymerase specialized sigma subunit
MKYGAMEARTKERLSNQCLTQEKKIKAALEICRQRSSVEPTIEEIADEAGLTEQEYLLALADMNYNYPTSLSQPLSDGITTVGDTLISDKSCYDCVSAIDTNDAINDILLLLPQDHRYIATLLIGGYTLSETATIIQKSMTSVSVMWADLAQFMYDHLIEIGYEEIFEGWFRDGELPPWRALFRRRVSSVGTIPLD